MHPPLPPTETIPTLSTDRLLLRSFRPDDAAEFAALHQDPAFYRFLGGKPHSAEDVWRRMLCHRGHWSWLGYGYWAVEEKATGRFGGAVGFAELHRDLTPSIAGVPEAGWVLAPRLHRGGYGTEAVAAIMAWGDANFGNSPTVCLIDPDNVASLALATKFGYQEIARPIYHEAPIVLLERVTGDGVMGNKK